MIDINELRRKISSVDIVDHVDIHANVKPVLTELLDRLEAAEKEHDALRAKVAEMEKQEPACWAPRFAINLGGSALRFDACRINLWGNEGIPLYVLPGAKALLRVPDAVMAALDNLDDYIARIEGNDRGACNHINLLRRYLVDATEVGENK